MRVLVLDTCGDIELRDSETLEFIDSLSDNPFFRHDYPELTKSIEEMKKLKLVVKEELKKLRKEAREKRELFWSIYGKGAYLFYDEIRQGFFEEVFRDTIKEEAERQKKCCHYDFKVPITEVLVNVWVNILTNLPEFVIVNVQLCFYNKYKKKYLHMKEVFKTHRAKAKISKICQILKNAEQDQEWGIENSAELCCGDCEKCPHYIEKV